MPLWVIFGLISLTLMGLGNFFLKWAGLMGQSSWAVTTAIFTVHAAFAAGLFFVTRPEMTQSGPGLAVSLLGGVCLAVAILFLMLAYGEPDSNTAIATALLNANFAMVAVMSFMFFQETLTLKQVAGLVVVLAGFALLV